MESEDGSGRLMMTLRIRQRGESGRELGTEYWRFVLVVVIDGVENIKIAQLISWDKR